jgi:hypothetical protein
MTDRGALLHVRHSLRWRARRMGVAGGFMVQFFNGVSASHTHSSRRHRQTRHTTTPQRWQSPTMSRAHLPMRPLVIRRPGAKLNWVSRTASLSLSSCSLQQCSVCLTSWSRYSSRFARNCLHVRDKSCRVLRSSCLASWLTILHG